MQKSPRGYSTTSAPAREAHRAPAPPTATAWALVERAVAARDLPAVLLAVAALVEPPAPITPAAPSQADRLLRVGEVAARLGLSVDWVYENQHKLPFRVHLGPRKVRFSAAGLEEYLARQTGLVPR